MIAVQNIYLNKRHAILALYVALGLSQPLFAGSHGNQYGTDDPLPPVTETDSRSAEPQALEVNVSAEERLRLRNDLETYSRAEDPDHDQMEARRHAMRERVKQRFQSADKDSDGSISRGEAWESMPQLARHFEQVDTNNDDIITEDEMEAAQTRMLERQRAASAKNDVQEPKRKSKYPANRRRAL
jgi:hypothetical protein